VQPALGGMEIHGRVRHIGSHFIDFAMLEMNLKQPLRSRRLDRGRPREDILRRGDDRHMDARGNAFILIVGMERPSETRLIPLQVDPGGVAHGRANHLSRARLEAAQGGDSCTFFFEQQNYYRHRGEVGSDVETGKLPHLIFLGGYGAFRFREQFLRSCDACDGDTDGCGAWNVRWDACLRVLVFVQAIDIGLQFSFETDLIFRSPSDEKLAKQRTGGLGLEIAIQLQYAVSGQVTSVAARRQWLFSGLA
jgi:hypothetical protein